MPNLDGDGMDEKIREAVHPLEQVAYRAFRHELYGRWSTILGPMESWPACCFAVGI